MPESSVFVVKTDSPSQGKGVFVSEDIEEALDDMRTLLLRGVAVRAERVSAGYRIHNSGWLGTGLSA
jgi:phosphoribosylamine-glycine ligase